MTAPFPIQRPVVAPAAPAAASSVQKSPKDQAAMKDAAEAFEAIFLRQMIGAMRSATPGDTLFGNEATNQFRELSDARLADNMAKTGSFGIAEMLLKQFGERP